MDDTAIRYKAIVDWIELEIQTDKPTNAQTVRRQLEKTLKLPADVNASFVKPINAGNGGETITFRFKVQDVHKFHVIENVLKDMAIQFGPVSSKITAVEIALDVYGGDSARIVANLYRFNTLYVGNNRRLYRTGRDFTQAMPTRLDSLVKLIKEGYGIKVSESDNGKVKDEQCAIVQHGYWKTTDNNGTPLPEIDWRARLEVTLRNDALPFSTLDELKTFRFEQLAKRYFRFAEWNIETETETNDDARYVIAAIGNPDIVRALGERRPRERRAGGGDRYYSTLMQADAKLTEKARQALRNLSGRWCRDARQDRINPRADKVQGKAEIRANSVNQISVTPCKCRKPASNSINYTVTLNTDTDSLSAISPQEHHQEGVTEAKPKEAHQQDQHVTALSDGLAFSNAQAQSKSPATSRSFGLSASLSTSASEDDENNRRETKAD